jgi:hypothetical protein
MFMDALGSKISWGDVKKWMKEPKIGPQFASEDIRKEIASRLNRLPGASNWDNQELIKRWKD